MCHSGAKQKCLDCTKTRVNRADKNKIRRNKHKIRTKRSNNNPIKHLAEPDQRITRKKRYQTQIFKTIV